MFLLNFVKIGWVESYGANADDMVSHIFPAGQEVK
jgi:hypothetical protein